MGSVCKLARKMSTGVCGGKEKEKGGREERGKEKGMREMRRRRGKGEEKRKEGRK